MTYQKKLVDQKESPRHKRSSYQANEAAWQEKAAIVKKLLKEDQASFFSGHSVKLFRWLDQNLTALRNDGLHAHKIPVMKEIEALFSMLDLPDIIKGVVPKLKTQCCWMANFNDLLAFREANPNRWPHITAGNKTERRLAAWCIEIRYQCRKNALGKEWIDKLQAISFNFINHV